MNNFYDELPDLYPQGYAKGLKAEQAFLGSVCGMTGGGQYYVRQPSGAWSEMSSVKAVALSLAQNYMGRGTPHNIAEDDIKKFLKNEVPVVRGGMVVPSSRAPAVQFDGGCFINTWLDTTLPPDHAAVNDLMLQTPLTLFWRMLREGLCGGEAEKPLHEMMALASGDDPAEMQFRFLISWLAAAVQSPGRNLQTNAWLLGDLGGIGKGILTQVILPTIYGQQYCALLSPEEIEKGGWNDFLVDKLYVVVDELEGAGKRAHDWNGYIKKYSTAPVIPIRKRHHNSFNALNFANWIFTSNDEAPACLDAHDRRNCLIAATTDPAKKQIALALWNWINTHPDQVRRFCGAIVFMLHHHTVNERLIEFAPETMLKAEVQEATSKDIEGLYWLQNDDDYPRGVWLRAVDYMPDYVRFCHMHAPHPRKMGAIMAKLARKKFIEMRKVSKTHAAEYWVSAERFPRFSETKSAMDGMRERASNPVALSLVPKAR